MKHILFLSILLLLITTSIIGQISNSTFTIVCKQKRHLSKSNYTSDLEDMAVKNHSKITIKNCYFPFEKSTTKRSDIKIDNILKINVISTKSMAIEFIKQLQSTNNYEYVELVTPPQLLSTPDDPFFTAGNQNYLELIRATDAWNITTGDSNIVIGIVDAGFDIDNRDLKNNLKYNYHDLIDGLDNDNDGFTDNYKGWDIGENDLDVKAVNNNHATAVAGIACAGTNDGYGMAGVAYNCKFLPVKVSNEDNVLINAYEGIIYAANHGCDIINCSWGTDAYSGQYGQDVINYAVLEKNALVIASAGNSGSNTAFYPASYKYVLSVAATDSNDVLIQESAHSNFVDITAPGKNIYSAGDDVVYDYFTGTSYSTAIVSGAAALLKSYYPNYTPLQIAAQLKNSATDISISNPSYNNLIGSGRLNIYNALTASEQPALFMENIEFTDGNNMIFEGNEDVLIYADFINYLYDSEGNIKITVTENSPYIIPKNNGSISLSLMDGGDTIRNTNTPFELSLIGNIPANHVVWLTFTFKDIGGSYQGYQQIPIVLNANYININTNKINTTITGTGRIGFLQKSDYGMGYIVENDKQTLAEGGLMIGFSTNNIIDFLPNENGYNRSFCAQERIAENINYPFADFFAKAIFTDDSAEINTGISITQTVIADNNADIDKSIIIEYQIINTSDNMISNLYAGYYCDWNIEEYTHNITDYDENTKLGYTYCSDGIGYAGIKALTEQPVHFYGIDGSYGNGGVFISDGFTDNEKYTALTTNRYQAGADGYGNDVKSLLSYGPLNINAGDTAIIAFSLSYDNQLLTLKQQAINCQSKYNEIASFVKTIQENSNSMLGKNYPNPATDITYIPININTNTANAEIRIFDIYGNKIKAYPLYTTEQVLKINTKGFKSGIYYYVLYKNNTAIDTKNMLIIK